MTSRPRPVPIDRSLLPGLAAVALFAILAAVFLAADTSSLTESWGFYGESVVSGIGAALLGVDPTRVGLEQLGVESFVVALLVIAITLDAALDGSLMLAKRDEGAVGGDPVTDGGRESDPADVADDAGATDDAPADGEGGAA